MVAAQNWWFEQVCAGTDIASVVLSLIKRLN